MSITYLLVLMLHKYMVARHTLGKCVLLQLIRGSPKQGSDQDTLHVLQPKAEGVWA